MPIADCRLPIADCRLPIADCRLPIADCRFYGNGVCGQVGLVGLCHVFSSCIMPMTSATDKSYYTHKNPNVKVFCSFLFPPERAGMTIWLLKRVKAVYCCFQGFVVAVSCQCFLPYLAGLVVLFGLP